MLPILLTPAFVDYLWGGDRLKSVFHKRTDLSPLAESWELSCHPDGPSVAASGPYSGKTLAWILQRESAALGGNCAHYPDFPLLIKLIDAQKPLSIQVHPGDAYAREFENTNGKTEMWYILDAEPDSFVYYGLRRPVTKSEMRDAIETSTLETLLDKRPAKRGDVIFIPAGTLHAIGAGLLVCEVQQNSNITYRAYDYGRLEANGKPRQLHVEKALDVSILEPARGGFSPMGTPSRQGDVQAVLLAQCDYFQTFRLDISGDFDCETCGDTFHSLLCIEGGGALVCQGQSIAFSKGDSIFIPADAGAYTVRGDCALVATGVPPATEQLSGVLPHSF